MRIEVVSYNTDWPAAYVREQAKLARALGSVLCQAHHIGSTSVPNLKAKPVIDILLEVTSLEGLDAVSLKMAELGYEVMGEFGIEGRRYFRKGGHNRTHHVHAFVSGDANVSRHLAFRDYLKAHLEVAQEYGDLKASLASRYADNNEAYCDGKDAFIKMYETRALLWWDTGK